MGVGMQPQGEQHETPQGYFSPILLWNKSWSIVEWQYDTVTLTGENLLEPVEENGK